MQKENMIRPMLVPHSDKAKALDIDSASIPKWRRDVNQIVAELCVYRIKHKISQAELARRINSTQSAIARFERLGRIPTIEFIYKIAEGLGADLEPLSLKIKSPRQRPLPQEAVIPTKAQALKASHTGS